TAELSEQAPDRAARARRFGFAIGDGHLWRLPTPSMIVTAMAAPLLFDRNLVLARRLRALRQGAEPFLLDATARELVERLSAVKRRFARALDLGTPGDALASALQQRNK